MAPFYLPVITTTEHLSLGKEKVNSVGGGGVVRETLFIMVGAWQL